VTRRIVYVSGTRAEFGLMEGALHLLHKREDVDLKIIPTGMHLSGIYGNTIGDIRDSGLDIAVTIPVLSDEGTGAATAVALGRLLIELVPALQRLNPDAVLITGDRGEMLTTALAAAHLNKHIFHVHGGERSGTLDESIRHAISKLSHYHLVATEESKNRLTRMGERSDRIWVTGAPGIDDLYSVTITERSDLYRKVGFDPERTTVLLIYHPVLMSCEEAGFEFSAILEGVMKQNCQVLCLMPNSDGGSNLIRKEIQSIDSPSVIVRKHMPRLEYLSWMMNVDAMVGNSSSGIIEAASFGTPVINVGTRQNLRERNRNVVDIEVDSTQVSNAVANARKHGKFERLNIYGDGLASHRIVKIVAETQLLKDDLYKANTY
jgi:GDP/UDP-N,N'-diacetylbacillosamine 2-epimerase (hydrolysing)